MSSIAKLLPPALKRFLFRKVLRGSNVYCNCCDSHLATFYPYGNPPRHNSYCPVCHSLERHRLTWHYLKNDFRILDKIQEAKTKGKKYSILHVAPEPAMFAIFSKLKDAEYIPCDKFEEGYDEYPKITRNYDLTDLPEPDDRFDLIVCSHVLEHIPEHKKALAEIRRTLTPEGTAILLVPMDMNLPDTYEDWSLTTPEERKKAFGQHDHVRLYGRNFDSVVAREGFKVEVCEWAKNADAATSFKYGLWDNDLLFTAQKVLVPYKN
ncbi:MAG: class I SAM-dependent methyltransferase [Bernardetiaceae bacterium]|nr:class I SAM-dependent methyltransferase [Bernardetiaceae bacterium]